MRYIFLMAFAVSSGCASRMSCRLASDLSTRHDVEICERRECRDLATGQFVRCPAELRQ